MQPGCVQEVDSGVNFILAIPVGSLSIYGVPSLLGCSGLLVSIMVCISHEICIIICTIGEINQVIALTH